MKMAGVHNICSHPFHINSNGYDVEALMTEPGVRPGSDEKSSGRSQAEFQTMKFEAYLELEVFSTYWLIGIISNRCRCFYQWPKDKHENEISMENENIFTCLRAMYS
jgi:hypothetical protein